MVFGVLSPQVNGVGDVLAVFDNQIHDGVLFQVLQLLNKISEQKQ